MTTENKKTSTYDYQIRPHQCDRHNYWDQVRRTVKGQVIDQIQENLMYQMIKDHLSFSTNDQLLDLCCGNGRLAHEFKKDFLYCFGVDNSQILIDIANEDFYVPNKHEFEKSDVLTFLKSYPQPARFTKCLIFGSIQYLPLDIINKIFKLLHEKYTSLSHIYISPIPDRSKADKFFTTSSYDIDDPTSIIGLWFCRDEFEQIALSSGWCIKIMDLPKKHYQYDSRFSAILTRK